MSHQLLEITDRKTIDKFTRSVAAHEHVHHRVVKLWFCMACHCYWEYMVQERREDGSVEYHRWSWQILVGRQEGGCL